MYTFGDLASLITAGYAFLFLMVAGLVAWLVRPWLWKGVGLLIVAIAFAVPLVQSHLKEQERVERNRMIAERFAKLCKENAGDKVLRTVEGVEGFLILRPRKPTSSLQEYSDQYWMGDPYGHSDLEAKEPEELFLADQRGHAEPGKVILGPLPGYDFIELPLPLEGHDERQRYIRIEVAHRYTDRHGEQRVAYKKVITDTPRSRFAYDWEDISTSEDRKYWTAGGQLRIVDLSTRELIAERTGYVMDVEQGARHGGGIPWLLAQRNACPAFGSRQTKTKEFIASVLKPAREKAK